MLRCIIADWSGVSSLYALAGRNLFLVSFRIKSNLKDSKALYFKTLARLFFTLRRSGVVYDRMNDSPVWFYDATGYSRNLRLDYLNSFSSDTIGGSVFKSDLLFSRSVAVYLMNCFFLLLISVVFLPLLLVKKHASSVVLLLSEYFEIVNLAYILKKNGVKELYFFCIYEKDANLTYLFLKRFGVRVKKITSEVPLALWNKIILTDDLIICSGYQRSEVDHYRKTMRYERLIQWGPEESTKSKALYPPQKYCSEKVIGFYSTANWIRSLRNELLDNDHVLEDENKLKKYLADFVIAYPDFKLKIYLHPREKNEENMHLTREHYAAYCAGANYEFANLHQPTASLFNDCNIAVVLYSTIVLERLYYGFKTFIFPVSYDEFPLNPSGLYNISVFSKEELFERIRLGSGMTNREFFEKYGLMSYTNYLT